MQYLIYVIGGGGEEGGGGTDIHNKQKNYIYMDRQTDEHTEVHMAGVHQEGTHIKKMLLFSSKLLTLWPSGDNTLYLKDKTFMANFMLVGFTQNKPKKCTWGCLKVGLK